jgi:Flp pilus assembly protein TadG
VRSLLLSWHNRLSIRDEGAQMVEFAVALPLLVVFVVGIFDFSGAFTLKQKLTNLARDAARVAAAGPASDSSSATVPASVSDAFQVVNNYFVANNMNFCGMTSGSGVRSAPAKWTYSANGNGCPAPGLTVIINRGYYFAQNVSVQPAPATCTAQAVGGQSAVIATCVNISYAYSWRFGRVASLLGSAPALPPKINATAVAMNEN